MPTYEQLVELIGELAPPDQTAQRDIYWLTDSRIVGISRTHQNRIEIFLVGCELTPASRNVKQAIEYQPWWHQGVRNAAFDANRLLLSAAGHFDQVAALLCIELLRNGADDDLALAFKRTEPIIALAIERLRLTDEALLGLTGELLLLSALCRRADSADVAGVVEAWAGWQPSLRDFSWKSVGAEIKTTTRPTSTHHIQGTHQVEVSDRTAHDQRESRLYLVSIGLRPMAPHDNTITVPALTDRVLDRLALVNRQDTADTFLAHVKEYGSGSGFGYDHHTMAADAAFTQAFAVAFVRSYDMNDDNIEVLRRRDVVVHQHVDADSLAYSIELPPRVNGDLNPVDGLHQAVLAILGDATDEFDAY